MNRIRIGEKWIGLSEPVYFIADIAANHDGSLERATELIRLAAEAGADAAKFQHFRAPKIVSQEGFESMGDQFSHQAKWKKSVFEVYQDASVPWGWTAALKIACQEAGIEFLSSPYDFEAVDMLDDYMEAYKIGSGDITWLDHLKHIAQKGKPVLLATGASDSDDVQRAVDAILAINPRLVLMQCNTNYTASPENFSHLQLNVLKTYETMYPDIILGLSDHTAGPAAVLGAVALGARVIEKHFTDDTGREGPDHPFSTDPAAWRQMVDLTRQLERALGDGHKRIQPNEQDTVVIQRRCLRAARDLPAGTCLTDADIDVLRPAPGDAIFPYDLCRVVSRKTRVALPKGECIRWTDLA